MYCVGHRLGYASLQFSSPVYAAQEKEKKCCCPLVFQSLQPIQYLTVLTQQNVVLLISSKIKTSNICLVALISLWCPQFFPYFNERSNRNYIKGVSHQLGLGVQPEKIVSLYLRYLWLSHLLVCFQGSGLPTFYRPLLV